MPTRWPARCSTSTMACLCSGNTSAKPSASSTRAVRLAVPGGSLPAVACTQGTLWMLLLPHFCSRGPCMFCPWHAEGTARSCHDSRPLMAGGPSPSHGCRDATPKPLLVPQSAVKTGRPASPAQPVCSMQVAEGCCAAAHA